jgi:hypothetical protein
LPPSDNNFRGNETGVLVSVILHEHIIIIITIIVVVVTAAANIKNRTEEKSNQ